jgi:hypothetical protein
LLEALNGNYTSNDTNTIGWPMVLFQNIQP